MEKSLSTGMNYHMQFQCIIIRLHSYLNEFMTLPNLCKFPTKFLFLQNIWGFGSFRPQIFRTIFLLGVHRLWLSLLP